MVNKNYYKEMTRLIYQDLAWGPIYKKSDGNYIKDTDNKSEIYIKKSLRIMKIPLKKLKTKQYLISELEEKVGFLRNMEQK